MEVVVLDSTTYRPVLLESTSNLVRSLFISQPELCEFDARRDRNWLHTVFQATAKLPELLHRAFANRDEALFTRESTPL